MQHLVACFRQATWGCQATDTGLCFPASLSSSPGWRSGTAVSLTVQGRQHETLHSSQSSFSEGGYDIKLCFWLLISVLNEKGIPVPLRVSHLCFI